MRIITYSEMPHRHGYVHLAYLSAAQANEAAGLAVVGALLAIAYFIAIGIGRVQGSLERFPRFWRWLSIVFGATVLGLLVLAFYINRELPALHG